FHEFTTRWGPCGSRASAAPPAPPVRRSNSPRLYGTWIAPSTRKARIDTVTPTVRLAVGLAAGLLSFPAGSATAQTFRLRFATGLKAAGAVGRAEPGVSRDVEVVAGKFGTAARIGPRGQLVYAAEQNFQAGRGTLACWCRIPERPGPLDVQRILFPRAHSLPRQQQG